MGRRIMISNDWSLAYAEPQLVSQTRGLNDRLFSDGIDRGAMAELEENGVLYVLMKIGPEEGYLDAIKVVYRNDNYAVIGVR